MGTSTDAILFYGYCWDQEAHWPWMIDRDDQDDHPDEDWMERYVRAKGMIVDGPNRTDWSRMRELTLASGCEVSTHCSSECPMPLVAVSASLIRSYRGRMNEVKELAVDPTWDGLLAEFCATLGIRTNGLRAAWWLVSDWS
jgi:hypothetical protein